MDFRAGNAEASARRAVARGLRVRVPLGVAECAGKYRRLSAKEGSEAGKYDVGRTPPLLAVHEALDERHPAEIVDFLKPTQIGGTTIAQNLLLWTILESPATCMVLLPTEKLGLRWVRAKFRPMVRATPALRRVVSIGTRKKRSDDDDSTMTEIHCGMTMILVASANIGSDLRMIPFRRLIFDEIDEYPSEIPGQGDPVAIAMERFNAYKGRRKCFRTSTPTDDSSRIAKGYAASSRGEYFVPCPHCGGMQTLDWANLKYTPTSDEDPESCNDAAYVCIACGVCIEERHKTEMLRRGQWRHRRPELCNTHIGFKLNCLYTPLGLGDRWQDNARLYEKAKKDPAKLRTFENTRLAIVHTGSNIKLEAADLKRRTLPYKLRTIPSGVLLLTAGVDVQFDRVEVKILGWSRDEKLTVVDYTVLPGSPTGTEVWEDLVEYIARPMLNSFNVAMRVECTLVDSGNWQHEVTNFTRGRKRDRIFASKGSTLTARQPIGRPTMVDVKYRGKVDQRGAEQYQIGVHTLKKTLFARLRADALVADRAEKENRMVSADELAVRFSCELDDDYFDQLTAEKYDAELGRFMNIRERNESLDTMVLAMAAGMHHSIAVHKYRELDWQRREQLYEPTGETRDPVKQEVGTVPVPTRSGFFPTRAITR